MYIYREREREGERDILYSTLGTGDVRRVILSFLRPGGGDGSLRSLCACFVLDYFSLWLTQLVNTVF